MQLARIALALALAAAILLGNRELDEDSSSSAHPNLSELELLWLDTLSSHYGLPDPRTATVDRFIDAMEEQLTVDDEWHETYVIDIQASFPFVVAKTGGADALEESSRHNGFYAHRFLYLAYLNGTQGLPFSPEKARKLLMEPAHAGGLVAQCMLADAYAHGVTRYGTIVIEKDKGAALHWIAKARESHPSARDAKSLASPPCNLPNAATRH